MQSVSADGTCIFNILCLTDDVECSRKRVKYETCFLISYLILMDIFQFVIFIHPYSKIETEME